MRASAFLLALTTIVSSSARAGVDVAIGPDVPAAAETRAVVDDTWQRLNEHWWRVTSTSPPWSARLAVRRAFTVSAQLAATSTPGVIEVRSSSSSSLTPEQVLALRHEVVHQHLWLTCPQAGRDRLFHEAVAVALSGEAAAWDSERYQTLPQTAKALRDNDLDSATGRRALARLLREESTSTGPMRVPRALAARLRSCADHAAWQPLTIDALVGLAAIPTTDALVVIHRATGDVIEQQGDIDLGLPFGSTLKPFLFAAALQRGARLPTLPRRPAAPTWACGATASSSMTPTEALRLSCNGWFFDWADSDTHAVDLGAWGTVLTALGLSALPTEMSEAIGARASLRMPVRGLAQAFRALSFRAPGAFDIAEVLRGRGTLKDAEDIDGLVGMAAKTGTVRDEASRAVLGVLVAFDDDVVIVRVRAGIPARALVGDVAAARARAARRVHDTVRVQTFGLLPVDDVVVRCDVAVSVSSSVQISRAADLALADLVDDDRTALCLSAPWSVRIAGNSRPYAGTFSWSPPPALPTLPSTTPRQQAARVGSSFIFSTSRAAYVDAVLAAEDSAIRGEARVALARVVDHNVDHAEARHGGRPVCDTTHCQTFLGTRSRVDDTSRRLGDAIDVPFAPRAGWLPFSQGGSSSWTERRHSAEVRAAIGAYTALRIDDGVVVVVRPNSARGAEWDEVERVACELLRGRLRLPSCPTTVVMQGNELVFSGVGAGHGLGLDVEGAKQRSAAGSSADVILREAYGL